MVLSTLTVTSAADAGAGSLRAQIAAAAPGDTIDFSSKLAGQTIALTSGELAINQSLTIEGLGAHKLTISGNNTSRIFDVAAGVNLSVSDLTIANGMSDQGGGIQNAGILTLDNVIVSNNEALGDTNFAGVGGGVFNEPGASLTVTDSSFTNNQAVGGTGFGFGGGIFNLGTASVSGAKFSGNIAAGGAFALANGAGGQGGAIDCQNNATLTVDSSTFTGNQATQGTSNLAVGAAIDSEVGTTLIVSNSNFTGNSASGSVFASGGAIFTFQSTLSLTGCNFKSNQITSPGFSDGGAVEDQEGPATITDCTFIGNQDLGTNGASTASAAISNVLGAVMTLTHCTIADNVSHAGDGAAGVTSFGQANGGAIINETATLTITDCTIKNNLARGGDNNNNSGAPAPDAAFVGTAFGAGVFNLFGSTLNVSGTSFVGNQAISGSSAVGPGATAVGGAIDSDVGSTLNVSDSTFKVNRVVGGAGAPGFQGGAGFGGAVVNQGSSTATLSYCRFTGNQAIGGSGGAGAVGGDGIGGAIDVGQPLGPLFGGPDTSALTLSNSQITGNLALGGAGGTGAAGGNGIGGGIQAGFLDGISPTSLSVTDTTISGNQAVGGVGGSGANGGNGLGGGVYVAGGVGELDRTLIVGNLAAGGPAGAGGATGQGVGGGLYIAPNATVGGAAHTRVIGNVATTSNNDVFGTFNAS
jgi:hypothetical protein